VISFDKPGRDRKATNLEEVFTQARAEDDYGVVSMDLHFSVNGGEEKTVNLQQLTRESARSLTGAYTFFLEEYNLKPGDFISYFAKARDASNESTSDIYFIEVKPFEMEYKQSQQRRRSGPGRRSGSECSVASSERFDRGDAPLIREGDKYTDQERKDGYEAVARVRRNCALTRSSFSIAWAAGSAMSMKVRSKLRKWPSTCAGGERDGRRAAPLRKERAKMRFHPNSARLQRLLAADAIFREVQVAFGNQSRRRRWWQREQQELAGLFELELDKMKNQYETFSARNSSRRASRRVKPNDVSKSSRVATTGTRRTTSTPAQARRTGGRINDSNRR
jgi:hypothetical protein